jgi:iron(III) transport system substrate-binding protein
MRIRLTALITFAVLAAPLTSLAQTLPSYYPASYAKMIEASRTEPSVFIYSNVAETNWKPILAAFHEKYPWIKVATADSGPAISFERYYAESAANRRTADVIVAGAPDSWMRFIDRDQIADYVSPEAGHLPQWSMPKKGLYTFSADPMIIIYNKRLLSPNQYPVGIRQMIALATANPANFRQKYTTYDASSHPFAYAIHWAMVNEGHVGGWDYLTALAPFTRPEEAGVAMLDKVTAGEYLAAFYTSATTVWPYMSARGQVIDWVFPNDGVPIMVRGMSVTKAAQSPNSARLLVDFVLSREGEIAEAHGGMTPYRSDVTESEAGAPTFDSITQKVGGPQNVVMIGYERKMIDDYNEFIKRWNTLFVRK